MRSPLAPRLRGRRSSVVWGVRRSRGPSRLPGRTWCCSMPTCPAGGSRWWRRCTACISADRIAVLASYWHADEQREAVATGIGGTLLKHLDGSALARQLRALSEPNAATNTPDPEFPGIPAILDGSESIAYVETRISDGACAYPITPSTALAAVYQVAVANGTPNLWGTRLKFVEPESEHSSASAAEGFALAGGGVDQLHLCTGPHSHEGGPVRHRRQASAVPCSTSVARALTCQA